jgi:hypothetical protein
MLVVDSTNLCFLIKPYSIQLVLMTIEVVGVVVKLIGSDY